MVIYDNADYDDDDLMINIIIIITGDRDWRIQSFIYTCNFDNSDSAVHFIIF